MSCIWVSAQECSKQELCQLAELVRKERELKVIISFDAPFVQNNKNTVERSIDETLSQIGIRANLKGWNYLRSAVKICLEDREELEGITKRLYPAVAKQHKSSADKVEYAIRHAIEVCWKHGNAEKIQKVFGYDIVDGKRPTNSEFISRLTDYIEEWESPIYSMME